MATSPPPRLDHDLARHTVVTWRERLSDCSISCDFAYRPDAFVPICDTIAVAVEPPCPRFPEPNEPATSMLALREALEIWHAVSCCRGFGFHENPSFWEQALGITFQTPATKTPLVMTQVFPIVVVYWDPQGDREPLQGDNKKRELRFHLGTFFGLLGVESTTRSTAYQTSLARVRPVLLLSRTNGPPIRVKLRFRVADTARPLSLSLVGPEIQSIHIHLKSLSHAHCRDPHRGTEVVLTGLELDIRSRDVAELERSLRTLPRGLPIALVSNRFAANRVMGQDAIVPFLEAAIGREDELDGRLTLLDLTYMPDECLINLGVVCTLLPRSRSVCEVRLRVATSLSFLWVAYALFHPLTRQTRWTRLCLKDTISGPSELALLRRFRCRRNGFELLRAVAARGEHRMGRLPEGFEAVTGSQLPHVRTETVIQYGVLTSGTTVYAMSNPVTARNVLVVVPRETKVELVDYVDLDAPHVVTVIVPGFGLGLVSVRDLTAYTQRVYPGGPTSCLSVLHYETATSNRDKAAAFLKEVVSADLCHVRVTPPCAFLEQAMVHDHAIESIDGYHFTPQSHEWMQQLPRLHSLGLVCCSHDLDHLDLAIQSAFTGGRAGPLRALRLFIRVKKTPHAMWERPLRALVTSIVTTLRGLRVLELSLVDKYGYPSPTHSPFLADVVPPSQLDVTTRKCAFLSVLRTWRPQQYFALDAFVIAHIFAFYGPSLERVLTDQRECFLEF